MNNISQHAVMLDLQEALTQKRALKVESIISDFHKIDSRFKNLTAFAKAIAERLREEEKSNVTHTALLRSSSPYRKILEKGWTKSNKIVAKNNKQMIEKLEMASKIKQLTQQNLLKDKIIEKLQIENAIQREKNNNLLTDKLPSEENVKNIFVPYKKILDQACIPIGYLIFDPYAKKITEPYHKRQVLGESDFPEGFIDWFLESYTPK